jgi:chromate transporter
MATLWQLFSTFTKIGAFTIGGGYAMLPLIEREVVTTRKWVGTEDFLDMIVMAQTAPGILAVNISILVGNKLRGKKGAFVSALGSTLPSFVVILIFAFFLAKYQELPALQKMFRAVRHAVVALIAVPVFNLSKAAKLTWKTIWIPILSAFLIWYFGVSPIWIIFVAGVAGILVRLYRDYKSSEDVKK